MSAVAPEKRERGEKSERTATTARPDLPRRMESHLLFSRDILQNYAVQGSIFDREDHCINKIRQRAPTPLQGDMATELGSEEGSYHDQGHLPVLLVHVQGTEDSMHQHQELVVNMCSQYSRPCCGGIYHNMKWQYESGGWRGQLKGLGYYYAAAEMHSIVYILLFDNNFQQSGICSPHGRVVRTHPSS
jgi:hypothetical protein